MGSKQRTPLAKFDDIPGEIPTGTVPSNVKLDDIGRNAVGQLNNLTESDLTQNAVWRDLLAFTDYYRSFCSAKIIFRTLAKLTENKQRSDFQFKGTGPRLEKGGKDSSWVDVDVVFSYKNGSLAKDCAGIVSVIPDANGRWQIWMLRTWLECFDGSGHPDQLQPVAESKAQDDANNRNGLGEDDYGAIIVGGGQAGLSVAGRLKAVGVPNIILEKHAEIGDVWAKRYESLRWHTSKEHGNLPFGRTFSPDDDYMVPTKRIASGQKAWSEKYGINVRTSALVESASWDGEKWTVIASSSGGELKLKARNLVLALGTGHATPVSPEWASADKIQTSGFKGTILHSFNGYYSAKPWAGKRGVVIGTANTGHDVAEDMANAGMETTIVQRNHTFILPAEWLHHAEDIKYNAQIEPAVADREAFTYPNKILRDLTNEAIWKLIRASPERFDALEDAGFKLDRFGDIYDNLYVRLGGHYVDIGASARIVKGEIRLKTTPVEKLTEEGLQFEDGSEVKADLIVLCTGFDHVFRNDAARIVGTGIAEQMDDFWGVDREGEIRGNAKPAGHPNLYYQGGDVRMARFFSRFTALQIQADWLGSPLQPYLE